MKAVALTHYLPVDNLQAFLDVELPKPVASGRDLLVAVKAVSVNPVDTKVRRHMTRLRSRHAFLVGMPVA
jgi:NADPH2:quinone reductase